MILTHEALLKLILETKAVSLWNREKGPVYWYAANTPGPFYVNTENVIGAERAARLLETITKILADSPIADLRTSQIEEAVMAAYERDLTYKNIIETMAAKAKESFGPSSFDVISGGERRDWLFSIPLAKVMGVRHVTLFKNLETYCPEGFKEGETALHVSDLINNAASYFDAWLPALSHNKLKCAGTLCVTSRGSAGVQKLTAAGQKVAALNSIDTAFFEKCLESGLIDQGTLGELTLFFKSSREWASTYLMKNDSSFDLFDVANVDAKSFERLTAFFSNDLWKLANEHAILFDRILSAIAKRKQAA